MWTAVRRWRTNRGPRAGFPRQGLSRRAVGGRAVISRQLGGEATEEGKIVIMSCSILTVVASSWKPTEINLSVCNINFWMVKLPLVLRALIASMRGNGSHGAPRLALLK